MPAALPLVFDAPKRALPPRHLADLDAEGDLEQKLISGLANPNEVDEEAYKFKEILEAQRKGIDLESDPMIGPAPAPRAEGHIR